MKNNKLSKETVNLMPYRLKSEDSLDQVSGKHSYKPKFVYELLSSPDNSFSEMIKDFRSKGQEKQFKKIPYNDNDFQGPSSIHPDIEKVRSIQDQQVKWQAERKILLLRNQELVEEIGTLKSKLCDMDKATNSLEKQVRRLTSQLKGEESRSNPLQRTIDQLLQTNHDLRRELQVMESNLRRIKENRNVATCSQHDSVRDTKDVYENINTYLKVRVQKLLSDMKRISMSPKLQTVLEDFLEEILLLNQYTVGRQRSHKSVQQPQKESNLGSGVQRARLDKSIQKLRQIQRVVQKEQRLSYLGGRQFPNCKFGPSRHQLVHQNHEEDECQGRSRSKSKNKSNRKRIFN